uniref:Uncharacterized protein LOC100182582 n=1 Tax=Phallusia mammillata TaxID=59560 RepID=A0A6F9DIF7_9ASCI|nr:uncharacterized protein LOC100182582 [Phallusia mammillata]
MSSNNDSEERNPQPLGLVPLYPLPQLQLNTDKKSHKPPHVPNFGFSFLPPIYQQAQHYGTKTYFSDEQLKFEAQHMLGEVITEEALNLLEEIILDGVNPSPRAVKEHVKHEKDVFERFCKEISSNLVNDVLEEECYKSVIDFYDDLIFNHQKETKEKNHSEEIFTDLESEILEEVANDVIESCICGEVCMSIIHEVVCEEASLVAKDVLMHYGARIAFSQYKHITKCAADLVLDSMFVQSLLPKPPPPTATTLTVIDHMMLEILLIRSIQLHNNNEENCYPLKWYKKKAVLNVAMNIALDDLENKLSSKPSSL